MSRGKLSGCIPDGNTPSPLQFGHGCEPWKTRQLRHPRSQCQRPLQFGHGCEPWKTGWRMGGPDQWSSFNSATAVSRGKPLRQDRVTDRDARLQFGHGCEPWKTAGTARNDSPQGELQFGHGCEPWKTGAGWVAQHAT